MGGFGDGGNGTFWPCGSDGWERIGEGQSTSSPIRCSQLVVMKHVRHGLMEARPLFLGFSFVGNHASGFSFRGQCRGR